MTKSHSFCSLWMLCSFLCLAGVSNAQTAPNALAPTDSRASANDDYELNIVKKRIVESPMERSADVVIADGKQTGVTLRVGFHVVAQYAAISLRGVTGRVRFRASLAPIERVLARHRAIPASPLKPQ